MFVFFNEMNIFRFNWKNKIENSILSYKSRVSVAS